MSSSNQQKNRIRAATAAKVDVPPLAGHAAGAMRSKVKQLLQTENEMQTKDGLRQYVVSILPFIESLPADYSGEGNGLWFSGKPNQLVQFLSALSAAGIRVTVAEFENSPEPPWFCVAMMTAEQAQKVVEIYYQGYALIYNGC